MDPIATSLRTLKKVILGNGAQAKIRIGLFQKMPLAFLVKKRRPDSGSAPWAKDVLSKDDRT